MNLNKILFFILIFTFFQLSSAQNPTFDSLAFEITKISHYQKTKALLMLDTLYQMANRDSDSSLLIAYCIYEEAILKQRQGIIDTVLIDRINEKLSKKQLSIQENAVLQVALGIILFTQGKYADVFPIFLKELETFKQLKNNRIIIKILNYLGSICETINLNSLASYYYSEALANSTYKSREYFSTKIHCFNMIAKTNKEDAVDSLLSLIEIAKEEKLDYILFLLYINTGSYLLDINPEKALTYLEKVKEMNADSPLNMAILYGCMGSYYLSTKNYSESLRYLRMTQKVIEENKDFNNLPILYRDLSFLFEAQNNLDSALFYSKKGHELTQQLHSNTIAIETHQKYITNLLETQQKDLIIAEQKNELRNRQIIIILIIFLSAILLFLVFYQRNRRKNIELKTKLKLQELEKEKQDELLNSQIRELTSYSTLIAHKNNLLNKIHEMNIQMLDNKEDAAISVNKVNKVIRDDINVDLEWEKFKLHFDKIHPQFFEKLLQISADLTNENLRMCAYIKMGISQKSIAQMLNITHDSVFKSRNRLKKKLNLTEKNNLDEFINSIAHN